MDGRPEDREQVSHHLDGHPLALRIFARSMPPDCRGDPTRLWTLIFGNGEHTLEEKKRHLLEFYERRLPEAHRKALGLLALFRAPVGARTLEPLWEKLMHAAPLVRTLEFLHREHLLTDDPGSEGDRRYACHRRRILHFNVTSHPTAEWVVQQLREAFPEAGPYRYVILDRDTKFDADVITFRKATGLQPKRTASFERPPKMPPSNLVLTDPDSRSSNNRIIRASNGSPADICNRRFAFRINKTTSDLWVQALSLPKTIKPSGGHSESYLAVWRGDSFRA